MRHNVNVNFEAMKDKIWEILSEYGDYKIGEDELVEKLLNLHLVMWWKPDIEIRNRKNERIFSPYKSYQRVGFDEFIDDDGKRSSVGDLLPHFHTT